MADRVDYAAMIASEIKALKANKKIRVEKFKIKKPVSEIDKNSSRSIALDYLEVLRDFYDQCDGFHVVWRERSSKKQQEAASDPACGEICIPRFIETFVIHWKDRLWFDWMAREDATPAERERYELARALKGFDVMDQLLDKTLIIALFFKSPKPSSEKDIQVWYWNNKGIKFPMALTPSEYLRKSLEYHGLMGWQLFHMDSGDGMRDPAFCALLHTVLEPMRSFISSFMRIFQASELDYLKEEYKRIADLVGSLSSRGSS